MHWIVKISGILARTDVKQFLVMDQVIYYLPVVTEYSFAILHVNGTVEAIDFLLAVIGTWLIVIIRISSRTFDATQTEEECHIREISTTCSIRFNRLDELDSNSSSNFGIALEQRWKSRFKHRMSQSNIIIHFRTITIQDHYQHLCWNIFH